MIIVLSGPTWRSVIIDRKADKHGDELWDRFSTKNSADQVWWYTAILNVITKRGVSKDLSSTLAEQIAALQAQLAKA